MQKGVPQLPQAEAETAVADPPIHDHHRQQLMNDHRLSVMHTRVYDYWRPRVGAPTAYTLARLAWSDEAGYQSLKRQVGAGAAAPRQRE